MNKALAWFIRKAVPRRVLIMSIAKQNAEIAELLNVIRSKDMTIAQAEELIGTLSQRNREQAIALARVQGVVIPNQHGPQRRH